MHRPTRTYLAFGILAVIDIILTIILPPNTATVQQYHLSTAGYHVVALTVTIPMLVVWLAAFYGYARLDRYSWSIKKSPEGKAFTDISHGLRWLAWGFPISSIISTLFGGFAHRYPGTLGAALIISHYISLTISLIGMIIINNGTSRLTEVTDKAPSLRVIRWLLGWYVLLSVAYAYGTLHGLYHPKANPYHLPIALVMFTVVAPYLFAWLMGLFAAYQIWFYRQQIKGVFYNQALSLLASGLAIAILSSIGWQYITSSSGYLRRIDFNWRLLLAYLLLVLYAGGYILIALGANKLKKIEEV